MAHRRFPVKEKRGDRCGKSPSADLHYEPLSPRETLHPATLTINGTRWTIEHVRGIGVIDGDQVNGSGEPLSTNFVMVDGIGHRIMLGASFPDLVLGEVVMQLMRDGGIANTMLCPTDDQLAKAAGRST